MTPRLVLASQSPRRAQLLEMLGLTFEIQPADVDETQRPGEDPVRYAERLAREKALAVSADRPDALVIGSDTVVIVDDVVLGKPRDLPEAVEMLMRLQDRTHTVATGVAVAYEAKHAIASVESVSVAFRAFDERMARAYVMTGEPMDKAGAYGIQGFGATLVERIDGDFFAVMGLPIVRLMKLLEQLGWSYSFDGLRRIEPEWADTTREA